MPTVQEVESLKREVATLLTALAKADGVLEQMKKDLKDKMPEALSKRIESLKRKRAALEERFNTLLAEYEEKYGTYN